jgi:hypothetical protein
MWHPGDVGGENWASFRVSIVLEPASHPAQQIGPALILYGTLGAPRSIAAPPPHLDWDRSFLCSILYPTIVS